MEKCSKSKSMAVMASVLQTLFIPLTKETMLLAKVVPHSMSSQVSMVSDQPPIETPKG